MFTISFYTVFAESAPLAVTRFETLNEAVIYGQGSGRFYEIRDRRGNRVLDWEEVNAREPEEWVYDEEEQLWKRNQAGEERPVAVTAERRLATRFGMEAA